MSVVDFHTHILPAIDDGSESVEQSVAMLEQEAEQGIRRIVLTPHFYGDRDQPEDFLRRRADAAARLKRAISQWEDPPELFLGAEVYYFRGISEWDALPDLKIEGTSCILIEMPASPWTDQMYRELEQISSRRGLTPIIAHVDRYIAPFRTYGIPKRLRTLPVLVQANASFFLRSSTKRMALRMLKSGDIHLLGSDCHNMSDRSPNLWKAVQLIEHKLGKKVLRNMEHYQTMVLDE